MPDPFKVLGRLLVAGFRITGYFIVFLGQATWYLVCREPTRIGDAGGYLGREIIDALKDIVN